jgi:hypothetical protein
VADSAVTSGLADAGPELPIAAGSKNYSTIRSSERRDPVPPSRSVALGQLNTVIDQDRP